MGTGFNVKHKIACFLSHNRKLEKKLIRIKKSCDEVQQILCADSKQKK